ncbi:hypothetical protein CKAH01_06782 [Colletotrichum kahawae]|uniref:Uncharacterized protein n=1 Tax=Colletotrichum kahawae TaxID=34407 RepID=A0AAD9Y8Z4_COLKA|nr:hypothetical protein CKAH01_06782 [Colletotrichum kahawae]
MPRRPSAPWLPVLADVPGVLSHFFFSFFESAWYGTSPARHVVHERHRFEGKSTMPYASEGLPEAGGYLSAAAAERPDAGLGNSIDILRYTSAAFLPTNLISVFESNEHGEFGQRRWVSCRFDWLNLGHLGASDDTRIAPTIRRRDAAIQRRKRERKKHFAALHLVSKSIRLHTAAGLAIASFEIMAPITCSKLTVTLSTSAAVVSPLRSSPFDDEQR